MCCGRGALKALQVLRFISTKCVRERRYVTKAVSRSLSRVRALTAVTALCSTGVRFHSRSVYVGLYPALQLTLV